MESYALDSTMKLSRAEIEECVRYVHAGLTQEGKIHLPVDVVDDLTETYHKQSVTSLPLRPCEQAIVTITRPKSAALFADRVWSVGNPEEDSEVTFGWEVPMDVRWRALFDLGVMEAEADGSISEIRSAPGEATESFVTWLGEVSRDLAADYRRRGANVSPLYDSAAARDAEYKAGDQPVILAIVDGVMVVDENALAWDQVLEFRRDSEARVAYRRLVHWLDGELIGKSAVFIADEIAARLERYDWAVRKHGIETLAGTLERMVDPRLLTGASAVAAAMQFVVSQPMWSLMAAGGLLIGGAALSAGRVALARKDITMGHREIAYVHDVKRRFQPEHAV